MTLSQENLSARDSHSGSEQQYFILPKRLILKACNQFMVNAQKNPILNKNKVKVSRSEKRLLMV